VEDLINQVVSVNPEVVEVDSTGRVVDSEADFLPVRNQNIASINLFVCHK
jgi:hypothetical protein